MEVGRRKKEEAIKSIVSAINNVLTVLAVAITQEQIDRLHPLLNELSPKLNAYLNLLKQKAKGQQSTVNSQQSTVKLPFRLTFYQKCSCDAVYRL
jgi:RNA binding exosome subunit